MNHLGLQRICNECFATDIQKKVRYYLLISKLSDILKGIVHLRPSKQMMNERQLRAVEACNEPAVQPKDSSNAIIVQLAEEKYDSNDISNSEISSTDYNSDYLDSLPTNEGLYGVIVLAFA